MANTVTIPTATGNLTAFLKREFLPSIPPVSGSGSSADPAEQQNQYVLPTASQLASWRTVFQSLLAGAWGTAHLQARTISSTYNVVQFRDTGRIYYVLMEGVPGEIPDPGLPDTRNRGDVSPRNRSEDQAIVSTTPPSTRKAAPVAADA